MYIKGKCKCGREAKIEMHYDYRIRGHQTESSNCVCGNILCAIIAPSGATVITSKSVDERQVA